MATTTLDLQAGRYHGPDTPAFKAFSEVQTNWNRIKKMFEEGGGGVFVQVLANCTGGGKYTGTVYQSDTVGMACNVTALTLPEGATGVAALIINAEENGLATHWIKANTWASGAVRGTDTTGRPVVVIDGGYYRQASATLLGSSGNVEGVFGSSWTRDTSNVPVTPYLLTDVYVDPGDELNCEADPPKLIGIKRLFSIDAGGKAFAIGADAAFTIATGCCPDPITLTTQSFAASFVTAEEAQQAYTARSRIAISWI